MKNIKRDRAMKAVVLSLLTAPSLYAQEPPKVVAKCPSDAYIGLSLLESGELRHYNYGERAEPGYFYLSSLDQGESWSRVDIEGKRYYADVTNPYSGTMLRLYYDKGIWCIRYPNTQDGTLTRNKIMDHSYIMIKPPIFIRKGRRTLVAMHYAGGDDTQRGARVLYSDDDGVSWHESEKVVVPPHKKEGFHQGVRWNHNAVEPTLIELNDGRIWMLMRTAQDAHYQSYSYDGGETWTTPTPSPFYGTITMPTMGRLHDGRLLFVWNNTTPLPELPSGTGQREDVFTNRNVLHAALSEDDGKSWIGCRELFLDERRNAGDFGSAPGADKSVHQSQFVEYAPGKIVIAIGQHTLHRKILKFDVDWLYQNERTNQFENGLADWSTFLYYKGIKGHCGYNRKEGGRLVVHPSKKGGQVLHLAHPTNDSILYAGEGAVWNFPAARKGSFTTSIALPEGSKGGVLVLNDRWFNPTDTTAVHYAMYTLTLNRETLGICDSKFHTLRIAWNVTSRETKAELFVDKQRKPILTLPLQNLPQHGLSYAHFMASEEDDEIGLYIEKVEAKGLD